MITEKIADLSYKDLMHKVLFNAHKKNLYDLLSNGATPGLKGLQIGGLTGAGIGGIKGLYDTYRSDSPDKSFSDYAKGGLAGAAKWGLGGSLIGGGIGAGVGIVPNISKAFNNYKTINTLKDKSNELVDLYIKNKEYRYRGLNNIGTKAAWRFIQNDPLLNNDSGFAYIHSHFFGPMGSDAIKKWSQSSEDYYNTINPLSAGTKETQYALFILNFLDRLKNNKLNNDLFNRILDAEKVRKVLSKTSPDKLNLDRLPWSGDFDIPLLTDLVDHEKGKMTLIDDLIEKVKKSTALQDAYKDYREIDIFDNKVPFGTKVVLPGNNQYYKLD